ncbi:ABC transporter substrate-binding protein [Pseudomonas asiatica]|uniref:ABC transporter substrate-binding protein n=1 Tax=Pseudomonas asiatica TaxID=2219225 RepID=UPI0025704677|nr:ABC transporter substrate-binding protein [Pseudomonas asiatica]WJD72194.1 ABC transporter substrate-binding protein [Pseudomonas asiatica]
MVDSFPRKLTGPRIKLRRMACVLAMSTAIAPLGAVWAATLTAGSPPSSAPTTFLDTKTGKISGFMPEIAAEVARRAGLELEFGAVPYSTLIQSVVAGKIDLIVAGMTPTPKRAEVIDFSQPVTSFGEGIFIRDDNKRPYNSAQDFAGQTIGAMAGSDYAIKLEQLNIAKEVKYYENPGDLARDVSLKRVDLGMNDYPILKGQEAAGAMRDMHVVDGYKPLSLHDVAFGVRKGNQELLGKINVALAQMQEDGTTDAILKKWGMGKN